MNLTKNNETEKPAKERETELTTFTDQFYRSSIDPAYFITTFCQSLDVETGEKKVIPDYNYIIDVINRLEDARKTGKLKREVQKVLIEKSRQMIISWIVVAYCVWGLLFVDNFQALLISRKEELVDSRGDLKSLFAKARYILRNLPKHLKPSDNQLEMRHMHISYKARGSALTGESSNSESGRGGSYSVVLMDEAAFIPYSESVYGAVVSAAKELIILVSTPNGKANIFYRLRYTQNTGFIIITLHWRLRPERNEKWYHNQCQALGFNKMLIARELDISYEDSAEGKVFDIKTPEVVIPFNLENIREDIFRGCPVFTGWDFGFSDPTAYLIIIAKGDGYYIIDDYAMNKQPVEFHFNQWKQSVERFGIRNVVHYADPAGQARPQDGGKSLFEQYLDKGIMFQEGINSHILGVSAIQALLSTKKLFIYDNCRHITEALAQARYPVDRLGQVKGEKYEHNEHSHILDCLRYAIVTYNKFQFVDDDSYELRSGLEGNYFGKPDNV